jgi:hypothetical protein
MYVTLFLIGLVLSRLFGLALRGIDGRMTRPKRVPSWWR